jgi:hypothetical protein
MAQGGAGDPARVAGALESVQDIVRSMMQPT